LYDLVLKGGRVVDPAGGLDGVLDVAIEHGRIARLAAGIAPAEAAAASWTRGSSRTASAPT